MRGVVDIAIRIRYSIAKESTMSFGRVVAVALFLIGVAGPGCTKTNPLDCSDGTCSDPAHPYCDKDGTVDGAPNTCIKPACSTPNEFVECKGDTAVSCNATEDGYNLMQCPMGCTDAAHGCNMCTPNGMYCTAQGVQSCGSDGAPTTLEACAQGCVADPQPHCAHLVPRYLASVCDNGVTGDFDVSANASLGTDLDTSCTGGVVTQTAAPDICVVRSKTITIESGVTLKATGARLLALVADDALTIHGTLDASADAGTPGPGGGHLTSGGARGQMSNAGGGAGFQTAGGAGATATTDGGRANGGALQPDPAQLAVMVGGPGNDGGGGGGVLLIACRGSVSVDGLLDLGGGGGFGGYLASNGVSVNGGAGGGAGGYLVIQGWAVSLTGKVYANGGGGGGGYTGSATGQAGQDGSLNSNSGAPGGAAQGTGGAGGFGAAKFNAAGQGLHAGGAGGGGLGYLQAYTPTGVTPTITPLDLSPDFQPNLTVQTK